MLALYFILFGDLIYLCFARRPQSKVCVRVAIYDANGLQARMLWRFQNFAPAKSIKKDVQAASGF